ncbi:MAG: DUF21 domain-containing protein, partial [Bacteroidales bacterium]|nr:DUF21 domain-containing protein [Bacteroidales bacterium]
MTLLIIFALTALLLSFMCSLLESVLLSTTLSYSESVAQKSKGGKVLHKIKSNMDRPIGAILSLNTVANTIGASGVGAQVTKIWGNEYFGYASAILTLLILIFSEIIPKTLGTNNWRKLCIPAAYITRTIIYLIYPLVLITEFIQHVFSSKKNQTVSRDEITALTHIGERQGIIESNESQIVNNLFKLKFIKLNDIMTPRTVVLAADENLTLEKFFNNKDFLRYSRIPVYTESIDDITGFVLKSDILLHLANDEKNIKLKSLRRPITTCYQYTSILRFYDMMITKKEHIALVIDEYGGVEGIVTMEDVIETILGFEITDESDVQTDMRQFAKERWAKKMKHL